MTSIIRKKYSKKMLKTPQTLFSIEEVFKLNHSFLNILYFTIFTKLDSFCALKTCTFRL